jgi:hypothetical protein
LAGLFGSYKWLNQCLGSQAKELENKKMKLSDLSSFSPLRLTLSVAVGMAILSVGAGAQNSNNSYKVKHSATEKEPKSTVAVPAKTSAGNSSASASKNLESIERQTAKSSGPSHPQAAKKTQTAVAKPAKDGANPPMNFGGKGGKQTGTVRQSADPYKGRLKQKHSGG